MERGKKKEITQRRRDAEEAQRRREIRRSHKKRLTTEGTEGREWRVISGEWREKKKRVRRVARDDNLWLGGKTLGQEKPILRDQGWGTRGRIESVKAGER
jgi:hypothetical protein